MTLFNSIEDFAEAYNGKRVLVRVDFNVPQDKQSGEMTDDTRIRAAIPTLKYLREKGAKLVLMSHLGKPKDDIKKGKSEEEVHKLRSLEITVERLSELLGESVSLARDYLEKGIPDAEVVLLENTRFYPAEESKVEGERKEMAEKLARFGDYYVCDAFGSSHRKHTSVYDLCLLFPGKAAAGYLMDKEIRALQRIVSLEEKDKPFGAILGGAKVEDKIKVIENLYPKVEVMIIIGAMEFAFDKAQGKKVGDSLCQGSDIAKGLIEKGYLERIYTPEYVVIGQKLEKGFSSEYQVVQAGEIPDGYAGLDIGPKSIAEIKKRLIKCNTIFWNGPAGLFEQKPYDQGTKELAEFLAAFKGDVIVGGGDSVTAINKLGLQNSFYHVSTGGGASLEMLELKEGEYLPAVEALITAAK